MRKTQILIVIMVLMAPNLIAQTKHLKRGSTLSATPVVSVSRPTPVSGEGIAAPSGVKYWDIQSGEGTPAVKGHVVKVLYKAWVEGGKMFDSSTSLDKPTIFTLGAGQVIPGWEEGMEGMKAGGKRQIRVPAELAYGAAGVPPIVPPNSNLIFDVLLIEVQ
jgi:FKBP-type peptidyl-prolyl cis-trans isomerase